MSNKRVHQRKDGNYYFKLHGVTYVRAKRKDAERYYAELVSNEKRRKLIEDYGKADVRTLMVEWRGLTPTLRVSLNIISFAMLHIRE